MGNVILTSYTAEEIYQLSFRAAADAFKAIQSDQGKPREKTDQQTFLTRSETAKRLKISYPTLKDWTDRGYLKSYSLGGKIYYRSEQVESAMTEIPKTKK